MLLLVVDFDSVGDDGSFGGVVWVEVGFAELEGPDLGGFFLAFGAEVGLDCVVVVDLVSDVGDAVRRVCGGES